MSNLTFDSSARWPAKTKSIQGGVPQEAGHRTQGRTAKVTQEKGGVGQRAICQTAGEPGHVHVTLD